MPLISFASDNYAGAHPAVIDAISAANHGSAPSYGDDDVTATLRQRFRGLLGEQVEIFPVLTGTAANVIGLQAMLTRWGGVIAAAGSHINTDEGGAPEKVGGMKIIPVETENGKLTPAAIERHADSLPIHAAQPQVVSITQSTEVGTIYQLDEVRQISDTAHRLGLTVHLDGARVANAAAALGCSLRELTVETGIDVLCFGGTKNGAIGAEAIVVLNPDAVHGVDWLRKLNMQLTSKMRFVSAQLLALLTDDLWLRNAEHANRMAQRLRSGVETAMAASPLSGVRFTQPTEANGVFVTMEPERAARLRERFHFYDWNTAINEVRLLTSFQTMSDEVDEFVRAAVNSQPAVTTR